MSGASRRISSSLLRGGRMVRSPRSPANHQHRGSEVVDRSEQLCDGALIIDPRRFDGLLAALADSEHCRATHPFAELNDLLIFKRPSARVALDALADLGLLQGFIQDLCEVPIARH